MPKEKCRKEKLSIYLVKKGFDDEISKVMKLENSKPPVELSIPNTESFLYVKKEPTKPPPTWTKLFTEFQSLPEGLFGSRKSVGALLTCTISNRMFVCTFGTGFHLLKNDSIERDFGLKVSLNSVNPEKLRSLDKANYVTNPLNSRTQSTVDLGVFDLEVDSEMDMLYAITGLSKIEAFGSHVTGRDSLTLSLDVDLEKLSELLEESLRKYEAQLPKEFEWVDNIHKIKDKEQIQTLNQELDKLLGQKLFDNMWLGEPEVIDWENQIGYSFDMRNRTARHCTLHLDYLVNYFREKEITLTTENLIKQKVHVNDSEYNSCKAWQAYRCLYAEINFNNQYYILRNGQWYLVNSDFVNRVDAYLNSTSESGFDNYEFTFPTYASLREEDYNKLAEKECESLQIMDKELIKIGGPYDKVEFCDLINNDVDFIHVKYYSGSATLSHLFAQGYVAAEAFVSDIEFRTKLNEKLPDSSKLHDPQKRPTPNDYRIVFAVATDKELPKDLPFFSKVTLKNTLRHLKNLNFKVSIVSINIAPEIKAIKTYKPKKEKRS